MKQSTERILTTHVGSLPRPSDLLEMIQAKERGEAFDAAALSARVKGAVAEVVRRQAESGIDIIADGEMGRFGFIPYINERLTGLEPRPNPGGEGTWARSREHLAFPEYYAWAAQMPGAAGGAQPTRWVCTATIAYKGHQALARDIDNLKAALVQVRYEEAFMPAVSPAQLAGWNKNEFYKSDEEFRVAVADALHQEYRAIVDAGLVLQIDDPQLASHYTTHPELDIAQCRNWASATVELLNHALAGIPQQRVRYHTCYGINMGPRVHDLELKHIVDIMLRVNAGAYSFEAGNPRHEHEWRVWEEVKLPDGKVVIPGVITHGSNFVEHPEAIAQRIGRFAQVVGRENAIAGADCGFASFSTTCEVHPTVVWAKLASLAEGARLATKELWGRA
ncbi:MAG TPA: cobalamin-independent methionine synthase II family protein [Stellaceae bacterium]|nr:cobalamin-independent methionine synthase II family protein [Stellaceae bacterium]